MLLLLLLLLLLCHDDDDYDDDWIFSLLYIDIDNSTSSTAPSAIREYITDNCQYIYHSLGYMPDSTLLFIVILASNSKINQ